MPAPRLLPPIDELERLVRLGYTHQQIAEHWRSESGHHVSRSSVSAALSRAGLSSEAMRYKDELPWRVKGDHLTQYPARMLRLLGRRRADIPLTAEDSSRLDAWFDALQERNIVVAYAPDNGGFIYVDADEVGDNPSGVPIRPRIIHREEFADSGECS